MSSITTHAYTIWRCAHWHLCLPDYIFCHRGSHKASHRNPRNPLHCPYIWGRFMRWKNLVTYRTMINTWELLSRMISFLSWPESWLYTSHACHHPPGARTELMSISIRLIFRDDSRPPCRIARKWYHWEHIDENWFYELGEWHPSKHKARWIIDMWVPKILRWGSSHLRQQYASRIWQPR